MSHAASKAVDIILSNNSAGASGIITAKLAKAAAGVREMDKRLDGGIPMNVTARLTSNTRLGWEAGEMHLFI